MLGIIILSRLWQEREKFELIPLGKIYNKEKSCSKLKEQPIIGIHEDNAFSEGEVSWNKNLLKNMVEKLKVEGVDELFLAVHDRHFYGREISGYEEHHVDFEKKLGIDRVKNGVLGVLFKHEEASAIYRILRKHLDPQMDLDITDFVNDIVDYKENVIRRFLADKIYSLRCQILEPLVALDLIMQAKIGINDPLRNRICEAIEGIKDGKQFKEICKYLGWEEMKDPSDKYRQIIDQANRYVEIINQTGLIQKTNSETFQKDLKDFAQGIENRIADIER
jgi:hypothetical protein